MQSLIFFVYRPQGSVLGPNVCSMSIYSIVRQTVYYGYCKYKRVLKIVFKTLKAPFGDILLFVERVLSMICMKFDNSKFLLHTK